MSYEKRLAEMHENSTDWYWKLPLKMRIRVWRMRQSDLAIARKMDQLEGAAFDAAWQLNAGSDDPTATGRMTFPI